MTTLLIVGITVVVSIMAFSNQRLAGRLVFWPPAITQRHQYDRFLTHGLIHADQQHLFFNLITLFFFGRAVEGFYQDRLGIAGFAIFYALAIVVAVLPSYLRHRNDANYRCLGASGGVTAVLFAFILFRPWSTIYVFVIPVPAILYAAVYVIYTVYQGRQGRGNINHSAHLWGAAYGVAATIAIEPRAWPAFLAQLSQPGFHP